MYRGAPDIRRKTGYMEINMTRYKKFCLQIVRLPLVRQQPESRKAHWKTILPSGNSIMVSLDPQQH